MDTLLNACQCVNVNRICKGGGTGSEQRLDVARYRKADSNKGHACVLQITFASPNAPLTLSFTAGSEQELLLHLPLGLVSCGVDERGVGRQLLLFPFVYATKVENEPVLLTCLCELKDPTNRTPKLRHVVNSAAEHLSCL